MTPKDQQIAESLLTRSIALMRFTATERANVLRLLRTMEEELVELLVYSGKPLTVIAREDKARLLRQAREVIERMYGEVRDQVAGSLVEVGKIEAAAIVAGLSKAFQAMIEPNLPADAYLKRIADNTLIDGAPSAEWWQRQAGDTLFRFKAAVQQGLAQGETNAEIIQRVRGTANGYSMIEGKRVYNYTGGFMQATRANVAALVQTSVQTVANAARMDTFEANDDVIKGLRQLSTLDSHTTPVCVAYSGAEWKMDEERTPVAPNKLPFISPKGAATGTPRHWNAVARGEMVTTINGPKPIEKVAVGELVLTHRGRFRPVTAVMRKRNDTGVMRVIKLESGRTIRVTDEHPVLAAATATGRDGWLRADALKAGDELFQYNDEPVPVSVGLAVAKRNPDDYPSLFDAEEVFFSVLTGAGSVAASINLNNDFGLREREVAHAVADDVLAHEKEAKGAQALAKQDFAKRQAGKLFTLHDAQDALHRVRERGRVVLSHALGMVRIVGMRVLRQAPRPMVLAAHLARLLQCGHGHAGRFGVAANRDTVALAPSVQSARANAVLPLDCAKGFTSAEVLSGDQVRNDLLVSKVNHFNSIKVSDITIVAHQEDVFNIAVQDDETYLVDGVVVHNCRSLMVPVTKTFRELGIDLPEFPGTTRSASGGPVAADMTFDAFLKRKGDAYADELLGPGRAQLWREKKITLTQLLDQSGRPLTLKELKRRYG